MNSIINIIKCKKAHGALATAVIAAGSSLFTLSSCKDMMTVDTGDKTYVNAQDTIYSYLGIMRAMQDVAERQVILGEIRGDLVSPTEYTTDTLSAISNFDNPQDGTCSMLRMADYYNVINNCNFYIHNCDTDAVKSNIKYMIPEYAQVKAVRAWAYLQLVKNYGSVPFITEPVSNLGIIENFDHASNSVNKDNLVDRLIEDGLTQLVETKYPQYGNTANTWGDWKNGAVDISARNCFIPIRVVLGDLYLLRGNGEGDYMQAARYYYDYLKQETTPLYSQYCKATSNRNGTITDAATNSWGRWAGTYTYSAQTNEIISVIPGSANAGLGKMLTRVSDIFGYTPTSSQNSTESTDDEGTATGEYEVGGAISVTRNYKRQYCPSEAYNDVNYDQTYVNYTETGIAGRAPEPSYIKNHDARFGVSTDNTFSYEGINYPLCSKAAARSERGMEFFYTIPIYRKSLIWLRFAEAINRAGYPEYAFAILKEGLNQYTLPSMGTVTQTDTIIYTIDGYDYFKKINSETLQEVYIDKADKNNVWYYNEEDVFAAWTGGTVNTNKWSVDANITYKREIIPADISTKPMYYLKDTLRLTHFNNTFSFSDDVWNSTYGIHAKGAGFNKLNAGRDLAWTSTNTGQVTTNIFGIRDSVYYDFGKLLLSHGLVASPSTTLADTIDAVENIIVDELALETAFEGNRFTDLVRIAEHKNASGKKGTEWLANKIANRGSRKATETAPAKNAYDASLYSKLLNKANWYFSKPQ